MKLLDSRMLMFKTCIRDANFDKQKEHWHMSLAFGIDEAYSEQWEEMERGERMEVDDDKAWDRGYDLWWEGYRDYYSDNYVENYREGKGCDQYGKAWRDVKIYFQNNKFLSDIYTDDY